MPTNFVEELRWRGMLHDCTPEAEKELLKGSSVGYVGFDPTASSLHIGNLATLMLLVHFQRAGHKPLALVGGATGMIGDPSGKMAERGLLAEETIQFNLAGQRKQLEKFLDFDCGANAAEIVNNYDWFKEIGWIDFLRDVGKFITVNYMMAKDSVKNRMENGISFTEFSYQLMQGYDFYWLYKNKGCKIQMGGSDQWGNITTGTELIRRMDGGDVWALTCPLLTKADGQKFGKSEQGNIWLDAQMTSPYKFYQFWLNVNDADLPKLLRVFLLETQAEIEGWEQTHAQNPNALKRILAEKLTERVHSLADLQQAQQASNLLFGKSTLADFEQTLEPVLQEVFETLPAKSFTASEFESIPTNLDLLAAVIPLSKSELRRLVKGNGISINKGKINEAQANEKPSFDLLKNKYLLLQKGAKEYFLVKINE